MSQTPQKVLERINKVKTKKEKSLNLSFCGLSELPNEIFELKFLENIILNNNLLTALPEDMSLLLNLTSIDLSYNQFLTIPKPITKVQNLTSIDLSYNQLLTLPESIGDLQKLISLDLKSNQLTTLPESIGDLQNLVFFNLSNNQLTTLPKSMSKLSKLTILDLSYNQLKTLPKSISKLSKLITLDLSYNQLAALLELIGNLQNLASLDLGSNLLTTLPESIGYLQKLISLDLRNNQLATLPESIGGLRYLDVLDLNDNPLESPPKEITDQGFHAIMNYFQSLMEADTEEYLYEAKMVMVGRGEVGKTVLTKKLTIPEYLFTSAESTTKGIDVLKNPFNLKMNGLNSSDYFKFNIWDFGGQEKYDATHQFFITDRSIYLLLTEARKEDTYLEFEYWLNIIKLLGDKSPVIVVITKIDERTKQYPKHQYMLQHPNILDFVEVSCKDGYEETINRLKEKIKEAAKLLPQTKQKLSNKWVDIRKELEELARQKDYIGYNEYLAICERHKLNEKQAEFLSGYLNALGVIIHQIKDPVLKDTVIINTDWGIDGVYKVLDNENIIKNNGFFTKEDLNEIWNEDKYINKQDQLLQLMINYKLCFKCKDESGYIAPTLLPYDKPKGLTWKDKNNLKFEYRYTFMPAGLLSRFIVEAHNLMDGKNFWKDGIKICFENTQALIEEEYTNKKIKIKIEGENKKGLLTYIRILFSDIHSKFEKLEYQEMVPCNCDECCKEGVGDLTLFKLSSLMQREREGRKYIECEKGFVKEVEVKKLIDDITFNVTKEEKRNKAGMEINNINVYGQLNISDEVDLINFSAGKNENKPN